MKKLKGRIKIIGAPLAVDSKVFIVLEGGAEIEITHSIRGLVYTAVAGDISKVELQIMPAEIEALAGKNLIEEAHYNCKFCRDCEFHEDNSNKGRRSVYTPTTNSCMHILNIEERPTHLAVMYKLINHPKEINKHCNCEWFVKKRGFFARLFRGKHKDRIGRGKKIHLPEWDSPPPRKT